MIDKFRAENGSSVGHKLARIVPTRFGTRYVAACGTSAYHISSRVPEVVTCKRCLAKTAAQETPSAPAASRTPHPFMVRKMTGRGGVKWIVVRNPGGRRVSVHSTPIRSAAQAQADELNIGAMVRPAAEDDRPYEVRRAEAAAAYRRQAEE